MADTLDSPGGFVPFYTGEKALTLDMERVGTLYEQTIYHALANTLLTDTTGDPISGLVGAGCVVSVTGALAVSVAPGFGMYYDSTVTDAFESSYLPIVVPSAVAKSIAAHDATKPRFDIISVGPDVDLAEDESRNFKDPSTLVVSASTVKKLSKYSYVCTVTTGTAEVVPLDPATPTGHIAIARVRVPATSGTVTVDDLRPILTLSRDVGKDPCSDYAASFVPGTSTECEVTQSSTPSMILNVAGGEVVIGGVRRRMKRGTVTVTTAHATLARIDTVVANQIGTYSVVAGTAAGSPVAPTLTSSQLALAFLTVAALDTAIGTADILDARQRKPISALSLQTDCVTSAQIQALAVDTAELATSAVSTAKIASLAVTTAKIDDLAVTTAKLASDSVTTAKIVAGNVTGVKMSVVPVIPTLTIGSEIANVRAITIQAKDADGNNVSRVVRMELQVLANTGIPVTSGAEYTITIGASGTEVTPTTSATVSPRPYMMLDTNSSGQAQVTLTDAATGSNRGVWLRVLPFNTPGSPAVGDCGFN